jgi:hypoxanthine phosphoribosyltransferase
MCRKDENMEKVSVLISEEEVNKRIREMAEEINKDYKGCKCLKLIGILKGSVFFMTELAKHVTVPVKLDFMSVSSYQDGTESTGTVKIVKDLDEPIKGDDILVVEDIIDSGNTLSYLLKMFEERKPNSIKLCTLLDKPERRKVDVNVDYEGFKIPDKFVVGYGLDYAQRYRNLPYIGVIDFINE